MPAEAVHLSALEDTLAGATGALHRRTREPALREAARLGAVFVDLPYFAGFSLVVLRYLLKRPQAHSPWGDLYHQRAPMALGRALGEAGVRLARERHSRTEGEALAALALGYYSHAAIDTALHPLVNRLADDRAATLGDAPSRQHHEVEKYQSLLFHHERLGFDFLGTTTLRAHITIDARLLTRGPTAALVQGCIMAALGEAPGIASLASWAGGYRDYALLISSPAGTLIAPPAAQEREREQVYEAVDFPGRYQQALQRSRAWVAALCDYLEDGRFDAGARATLTRLVPEGTLDPGAEGAPPA